MSEQFGPIYPAMPNLNKYRRAANANGGVMQLDKFYRQEYGAAVEKEIRALQRAAVVRRDREGRSDEKVRELYEEAMKQKRGTQ